MICPLRFKEFSTEDAMQACQLDFALLMRWDREVTDTHYRDVYTCGLIAKEDRGKAVSHAYGEWEKRGSVSDVTEG